MTRTPEQIEDARRLSAAIMHEFDRQRTIVSQRPHLSAAAFRQWLDDANMLMAELE